MTEDKIPMSADIWDELEQDDEIGDIIRAYRRAKRRIEDRDGGEKRARA